MKIKAIAIDDEPLALKILENFSSKVEDFELEAVFTHSEKALNYIENNAVDVIFIDIQMPSILGTELVKKISPSILIVFTTAYSEYAAEGFDLNATDYLLKPFTFDRFEQCVQKIKEQSKLKLIPNKNSIVFKTDYSSVPIQLDEIKYIEGYDDYLKIHRVKASPLVVRMTFKIILTKLPSNIFIRIHKSYVVSKNFVTKFNLNKVEIDQETLPVGAIYRENLKILEY